MCCGFLTTAQASLTFSRGKDHLSHRLVRAGLSRKMAAVSLWALSALFGLLAVILTVVGKDSESYIVVGSFVLWTTLFIGFLKLLISNLIITLWFTKNNKL